jgi:CDP-diacylglycerol---glycerol-3-phosphate 3-phosphatidyltransferase
MVDKPLQLAEMKIPNILTLIRILISPVFLVCFTVHTLGAYIVCFLLAVLIELTDLFDGIIARKSNQITDFGKLMDPFADSIARFSIFLSFLSAGLAPLWMIAIFFYRDVLVSVVRVFAMREGVVLSARKSGKTKAWVQAVCTFAVLLLLILQRAKILPLQFSVEPAFTQLTTALIGMAALVTLWSAFDYWHHNKQAVYSAIRSQ